MKNTHISLFSLLFTFAFITINALNQSETKPTSDYLMQKPSKPSTKKLVMDYPICGRNPNTGIWTVKYKDASVRDLSKAASEDMDMLTAKR